MIYMNCVLLCIVCTLRLLGFEHFPFSLEKRKIKNHFDSSKNITIGKYNDGEDNIGFHTDDETFLEHHFCANVTLGAPRDFQFKIVKADGSKQTHEIKLENRSVFFFFGLEHALPKRARAKGVRYSISFRNMKNNIGIGNSFYYCRGLQGAEEDSKKEQYLKDMVEKA